VSTSLQILSTALLFSFIICCAVSGILQILAWARHTRQGAPVSFRALLHPGAYFDAVGLRQMHLARRLLTVGAAGYAGYVLIAVLAG
jgi:hypothetical protein